MQYECYKEAKMVIWKLDPILQFSYGFLYIFFLSHALSKKRCIGKLKIENVRSCHTLSKLSHDAVCSSMAFIQGFALQTE